MIRAGEAGGILEGVLRYLTEYLESTLALKEEVKSALIYPAILASAAGLSLIVMFVFVIPRFSAIFKDVNKSLPLITKLVINLSLTLSQYGWIILLVVVGMLEQEQRELTLGDGRQAIAELTGWVADDVREIALKAESDSYERALRQAIISLLPHFNAARDAIYLCLPQEQVISQQVFLPLAAQDNLQQVLEYEIERQLPFKREDIYYDFYPVGRKGEKFSVYVFAVPKKAVDGLLGLLESFGIKPRGIETTATALANYLLFTSAPTTGGAAMIAGHGPMPSAGWIASMLLPRDQAGAYLFIQSTTVKRPNWPMSLPKPSASR